MGTYRDESAFYGFLYDQTHTIASVEARLDFSNILFVLLRRNMYIVDASPHASATVC